MPTVTINILDSNGNVIEQKEIQDWQLEQYQSAGYNVQTLDSQPTTVQTITTEAQNIINDLQADKFDYPEWFNNIITWVKSGQISSQEFIKSFNDQIQAGNITSKQDEKIWIYRIYQDGSYDHLHVTQNFIDVQTSRGWIFSLTEPTQTPTPTPEPTPEPTPILNEKIDRNSVRLCGKNFDIESGKIKGQITLEKNSGLWNPYYNDIPLALVVQYMDINTNVVMDMSPYVVTFPEGIGANTNRIINIERSTAFDISNYARIKIEVYLWKSLDNSIPFSETLKFTLDADKEPIDICSAKPSIKRDDFMSKAVGIFGGLLGVSLLISGNRKV